MKDKRNIKTSEEFLDYYGIPMPSNGAEREMIILGNILGLKENPPADVDELDAYVDNLIEFIVDTKHIPYNQLN